MGSRFSRYAIIKKKKIKVLNVFYVLETYLVNTHLSFHYKIKKELVLLMHLIK